MAHQVTKEEIAAYNNMRIDLQGKILTINEVKENLRKTILPKSDSLVSYLIQGGIPALIRVGRGKYKFPEKPVHISVLQRAFDKKAKVQKKSNKKWRDKQTKEEVPAQIKILNACAEEFEKRKFLKKKEELLDVCLGQRIAEAAKLLKENGWLLKRPVTNYEDY